MLQFTVLAFGAILMFANKSNAQTHISFSTNTTSVQVGHSFTAICDLSNLNLSTFTNTEFGVHLYSSFSSRSLGYYEVQVSSSHQPKSIEFINQNQHIGIVVSPAIHNLTHYEIQVVPSKVADTVYYCNLYHGAPPNFNLNSSKILVSSIHSLPSITFTTNVVKVLPGNPFLATCTIANFENTNKKYSVKFFGKREGLLATYEVDAQGQVLLNSEVHDKVTVHNTARFAFPTFDLQITEKSNAEQTYWCALEDDSLTTKPTYKSNKWPLFVVNFQASHITNGRRGSCTIANFDPTGKEYHVKFFSETGPKNENLLATYSVLPGHQENFLTQHPNQYWSNITHGDSIVFPTFQVDVNFLVLTGNWWCTVGVGTEGRQDYMETKSNQVSVK